MNEYFKTHPGYNKGLINEKIREKSKIKKYKKDLYKYLKRFNKDANILEIGFGIWHFTYFCNEIGIKNYTGIDIDDYFFKLNMEEFPTYKFEKARFQDYLPKNEEEYDIIFTSHIFEHLDEIERIEMIKLVFSGLKNNGIWINYMPNADSVLLSNNGMYIDISHKRIYNSNSFEQLLNISLKNYEVEHINAYIGYSMFIKRLIHNIFLLVTKIYYKGMGMIAFPKIYTWEFISVIIKNKGKN